MEVNVFFPPSFDMCKEEGKERGLILGIIFFFIIEWLGEGGQGFFLLFTCGRKRRGEFFCFNFFFSLLSG